MKVQVERFEDSPVGHLVPVSGWDAYANRGYEHHAFVPDALPAELNLTQLTHKMIAGAAHAVGQLDFAVKRLPNPGLLVRPALRREAQSTSALEGTFATLEEVLEAELLDERSRRAEVREVMNHVHAAERALELTKTRPICLNILTELQEILVSGTRGESFDTGRLRKSTVYIGERTRGIEQSRFVPTPPGDRLIDGVSKWEKWINAEDHFDVLTKAALGHYQFETLHPFSDGNGRLGRLIITLQLIDAGALSYPVLNISPWFEDRKDEYKDHLLQVSATGDYNPWVQFFSEAVKAQAEDGVRRIEELLSYKDDVLQRLANHRVRGVAVRIAESLLGYPIITPTSAAKMHGVTYPPANSAIDRLVQLHVLREATGRSYGRAFICDDVMNILSRR